MRIPTHRGHRSDGKRDTIPTRLRTLFRAEGGHRSELIRDTFPNLDGADSVRFHPAGACSDAGESTQGILLPLRSTPKGEGMPAERLPMRKIKELLRLKFDCGLTDRQIGRSLGLGRTTVGKYLKRFALSGLSYPLPDDEDDVFISERLFPPVSSLPPHLSRPLPTWLEVQRELVKKGVTLMLLLEGNREQNPDGCQYR